MSIVTKLKDAAADGPALAGTLKLVADSAAGTYVAVDAFGTVLPLGGAPSGTWANMLPPAGELTGGTEGEAFTVGVINIGGGS